MKPENANLGTYLNPFHSHYILVDGTAAVNEKGYKKYEHEIK